MEKKSTKLTGTPPARNKSERQRLLCGLETIRAIHYWASERGGLDDRAPVPEPRAILEHFEAVDLVDVPEVYSQAYLAVMDTPYSGLDGCSAFEADGWCLDHPDAVYLVNAGLAPSMCNRFYLARLTGRAGGFKYNEKHVHNWHNGL